MHDNITDVCNDSSPLGQVPVPSQLPLRVVALCDIVGKGHPPPQSIISIVHLLLSVRETEREEMENIIFKNSRCQIWAVAKS